VRHVNAPAVSRLSLSVPLMTPVSARLSLPSATTAAIMSRSSPTVKSQSSLPVCGDSFFEDSEADHSHSNWSEFSSFDVSNIEPHDALSVPSSSNIVRSREVNASGLSTCNVQRSQSDNSFVTAASVTCSSSNTWLTSRQPNTLHVNSLPSSDVSRQKPANTSLVAAAPATCSSPSGLTDTFLSCL